MIRPIRRQAVDEPEARHAGRASCCHLEGNRAAHGKSDDIGPLNTEVIEHLENPWFFMRELYRITEPGGVVIISTPNLSSVYVRAWYALTGRLYNFLDSAYQNIGHITPIYLWNLKRMAEGKFDVEAVTVNASPIPKTRFRLPTKSRMFGQCVIVKLRRRPGSALAAPRVWTHSRIVRAGSDWSSQ